MEEFDAILRVIDALGTVAILVVVLRLFVRGDILPRAVVRDLLSESLSQCFEEWDKRLRQLES